MMHRAKHLGLCSALLLSTTADLQAQGKPAFSPPRTEDGILYQFQGRVVYAGGGMEAFTDNRVGGGIGFSALFGSEPLRLRLRMDGEGFPGKNGKGAVSSYGLGAEALVFLPFGDRVTPYLSCGPAFQHWDFAQNDQFPMHSRTTNHLAGRAELGLRFGRRTLVSLGVLVGSTVDGKSAVNPYVAVTF
jgi:hypothetical protein